MPDAVPAVLTPGRSELIVGGQKSGKSRRAETLAQAWLELAPDHRAVFIATARAGDAEMAARIERHRSDRAQRVPAMATIEEPLELAAAIRTHGRADTLLVVDCLTLWLTNLLWPGHGAQASAALGRAAPMLADPAAAIAALLQALKDTPGPLVLVSNEIGLGVIPMASEVRAFCDALGQLNQQVGGVCERVTMMFAGLPLVLKPAP